jgi:hypothetical protein
MIFTKWISSIVVLAVLFTGCKNRFETRGDQFLQEGNIRNAIRAYLAAEEKGSNSRSFYDNFSLAYIRLISEIDDPYSENISAALDLLENYLQGSSNRSVWDEYFQVIPNVANAKIATRDFNQIYIGFDLWRKLALRSNELSFRQQEINNLYDSTATSYVRELLQSASSYENTIAQEYMLTQAEVALGAHPLLDSALRIVRKANRHTFLIFSEHASGIARPSPLIDRYGFIAAFRQGELHIRPEQIRAYIQIWNSTGMNTALDASNIRLISKIGDEVQGTPQGSNGCRTLPLEGDCTLGVLFRFPSDFIPDYISIKNTVGEGRKYLGL